MAKYVTFYGGPMAAGHNLKDTPAGETPEELMAKIMAQFPAHRARLDRFAAEGKLDRDAEEFMAEDPFLLHGLVRSWRLMEWDETQVP